MTKARLGVSYISGSEFIQPRGPLFRSLMATNCSRERSFSSFKRIENALNGCNIPGEVVHTQHSVH